MDWHPKARERLINAVTDDVKYFSAHHFFHDCGSVYNRFSQVTSPSRGFEV
jgi:hypothetical protein